ncbi:MAG: phage portal protein [Planctomycetota bacterium]|jgi:lambda family phage portal protein
MLKLLSRLFQPHQATTKVVPLAVRGKYDAAQTTEDNRRHWAMADGLSAAAANSRSVRRTIRNRARYEVANNSYAKGIIATLANDVVGRGPILQVAAGAAEANTRIERAFSNWAIEIGLAQKLRTMRQSKAIDGEAFAMLVTNEALRSPIKLDLKLIEAEQVTDPDDSQNHADGIRFDQFGNPASYTVLREHPGSGTTSTEKLSPVPAENMIHWFGVDRPGQVRGIPDITPALPLFAQLRRFTLAVLAAAETAASFAAVLYTTAPANGEADDVDPFLPIEIEQRMMTTVPAGWQMGQLRPEQPCSTYAEFKRELINEIARCLNMPFNVAACNSASYNYASGRLDHQVYFKSIRVEQDALESIVLSKIFQAWLDEASLVPGLLPAGPYGDWASDRQWFWDGAEHVDPTKEASAQETRLRNHTTTLAEEYARQGKDWEQQLRQRARELELMQQLNLSPETPSQATQPSNATEDATTDQAAA